MRFGGNLSQFVRVAGFVGLVLVAAKAYEFRRNDRFGIDGITWRPSSFGLSSDRLLRSPAIFYLGVVGAFPGLLTFSQPGIVFAHRFPA